MIKRSRLFSSPLLILFLLISIFSNAQLTGEFKNYNPDKHKDIAIEFHYFSYFTHQQEDVKLSLDNQGKFSYDFPKQGFGEMVFLHIPKYFTGNFYVEKGLHITLNTSKKKRFSGPDAETSRFLAKLMRLSNGAYSKIRSEQVFYSKDSVHVRAKKLTEAYNTQIQKIKKFHKKKHAQFAHFSLDQATAQYYSDLILINYGKPLDPELQAKIQTFVPQHSSTTIGYYYRYLGMNMFNATDQNYYNRISNVMEQNLSADEFENFNSFLVEYKKRLNREGFDKEVYTEGKRAFLSKYSTAIYAAHADAFIAKVKDIPRNGRLILATMPSEIADRGQMYMRAKKVVEEEWALSALRELAAEDERTSKKILDMIVDGDDESPLGKWQAGNTSVSMYHAKHDSLNTLLEAIKQTYPNKIILMDIWGTWCGPCVKDIKASREKLVELQENNVEVIYLCEGRSSEEAVWIESVVKYNMNGNQVYMSKELTTQFIKKFNIVGYPSHVIISGNGEYHLDKDHFIQNLDVKKLVEEHGK